MPGSSFVTRAAMSSRSARQRLSFTRHHGSPFRAPGADVRKCCPSSPTAILGWGVACCHLYELGRAAAENVAQGGKGGETQTFGDLGDQAIDLFATEHHAPASVVDALAEKISSEKSSFTFEVVRKRFERAFL